MKTYFFAAALGLPLTAAGQQRVDSLFERTAATYLFDHAFPTDFPNTKKFAYFGRTENSVFSFGLFRGCGMLDSLLRISSDSVYRARVAQGTSPLHVPLQVGPKLIAHYNGRAPVVTLFARYPLPGAAVVPVVVHAARYRIFCYYVFLNPAGQVLNYCRVEAIQ
jgi:hypothetical protein